VLHLAWKQGSDATLRGLRGDQAVVDSGWAKSHHVRIGGTLSALTPEGRRERYRVVGIFDNKVGLTGDVILTDAALTRDWGARDFAVVLAAGTGDPDALDHRADSALKPFPAADPMTIAQYKDKQAKQVNQLLGLVFALLSRSVIVALLGIVNTLALSVHERTRELGMLRAVGMSRRQMRRMVRSEAVITAIIGAVLGLVLGVVFAALVSRPLADEGFAFTLPWGTLFLLLVLAALAGVLAAIPPARRAARVDVLRAVTTE
jgi:putative ABC transport system permease protein